MFIQFQMPTGPRQGINPLWGCLPLFALFFLLCLLPFFLYDTAKEALFRLGLSEQGAVLTILAIVFGSLINLPVRHIVRDELQPDLRLNPHEGQLERTFTRLREESLIAVNVGGCLVPLVLAAMQISRLSEMGNSALLVTVLVSVINILVCWKMARPVPGLGILIPALVPPLASVVATWLFLLPTGVESDQRAATAFVAGVMGPIIGADLLNLRKFSKMSIGTISIGGAGTFDAIVLSGILAALIA